jgi:DNA-binding LacI/PurR family transcriptional regulator
MERMTQLSSRPTAVFGVVDELAVGAIQCAREVGLRVPEDLSVIGMNDLEMAQICDPPLTTVRIFREEMGRVAVKRLVELIQNPQQRARRIDVLCELVKRASCAPVS